MTGLKTILVAEDRDASRELLCLVLQSAGYSVVEAVDGLDAVKKAREVTADLVIMDVYMPHLNGFEALEQIRLIPGYARTPMIALTASAMSGERERAMDAGFAEFITKPVNLAKLRSDIERLLR